MKILLIYPDSPVELIGWGDLGAIAEPLALEYLAAGAIECGHDVIILDMRLNGADLYDRLLTFNPDVVGLTGYSMHVLRMLELCREARRFCPLAKIVIGGHHATLLPEDFKVPEVDHIVVGEGVRPFVKMLDQIAGLEPVAPVLGVWSRIGEEYSFGGVQGAWHPDDLPEPARHLGEDNRSKYYIDWMRPIALVRTTVGCPFRCSFCSLWKLMDGLYEKRLLEKVVSELASIKEPYVFLVDDEPFIDTRRMAALAECIKEAGIKKEYFAYCRIDSFLRQEGVMRAWKEIGLKRLFFGIEAVIDGELKDYNKKLDIDSVSEALALAKDIGIHVFASFIVKPTYTKREFEQLADFIRNNEVEYPSFTILTPIPGTDDGNDFSKILDKQPNGRPNWSHFDLQHPVIETTLPKEEFMREYRALQNLFFDRYKAAGHPYFEKPSGSLLGDYK